MSSIQLLDSFQWRSRAAWRCATALTVQQLIVATSTVWITLLIRDVSSGRSFTMHLALYLASLSLPFVPGGLSLVFQAAWEQDMISGYVRRFVEANRDKPTLWASRQLRDQRISTLASESRQTLSSASNYAYRVFASVLNVSLNIGVVAFLLEPAFAVAYGVGLVGSALTYRLMLRRQARLVSAAQSCRVELTGEFLEAWDNLAIGNEYNFGVWNGAAAQALEAASSTAMRSAAWSQLTSVAIAMLTLAPTIGVILIKAFQSPWDRLSLAAMVVVLPRLFMVLTQTHELLSLGAQWTEHFQRLRGISSALASASLDLGPRIRWPQIRIGTPIASESVSSVEAARRLLPTKGRVTIRGANGAGKSTLLMLLKEEFGANAYLLPAHQSLRFAQMRKRGLSTGQALRANLEEIERSVGAEVVLLDEWAANLDVANRADLSQLIDRLAEKKCVVEIVH